MINRQPLRRLAFPSQPALALAPRVHTLLHRACQRREPKRAELEHAAFFELRALIGNADVGAILVVACPLRDIGELGPNLRGSDAFGDDLVGDEIVRCAGRVLVGEEDGGEGCRVCEGVGDGGLCGLHLLVNCTIWRIQCLMYGLGVPMV